MRLRKRGVLSTPNILINHSLIFLECNDRVTALIHIGTDDVLHRLYFANEAQRNSD